jgi:hypothetical protein
MVWCSDDVVMWLVVVAEKFQRNFSATSTCHPKDACLPLASLPALPTGSVSLHNFGNKFEFI